MPVVIPEVLNNLIGGDPQIYKALMAVLPQVRRFNIGTPSSVPTVSTLAHSVTVNGIDVGDFVAVVKPTEQTGLVVGSARVSAKNTLIVTYANPTAGGITPTASEIYLLLHAPGYASGVLNQVP